MNHVVYLTGPSKNGQKVRTRSDDFKKVLYSAVYFFNRVGENSSWNWVGAKHTRLRFWELEFNLFWHTVILHFQITSDRPQITPERFLDISATYVLHGVFRLDS